MLKQNNKRTSIIMSVIALLLILTLAAGFTFSWAEGGSRGKLDANSLVINSGSSLVMRQDNTVKNEIVIPFTSLDPVSSADGRNFFVPMEYNTSVDTDKMVFRKGAPIDVNKKYISVDFQLQAGDTVTPVYLGAGTGVTCSEQSVLEALRMSFSLNDAVNEAKIKDGVITANQDPLVFKPNQMPGVDKVINYNPITSITEVGSATTTATESKAYGDYYFKGEDKSTPIFNLAKGETKNITLTIWLEGTVATDVHAGKDFDIYIDFTTTTSDLTKYNFVDNTHGFIGANEEYWITNKADNDQYETMMYLFDNDTKRYYAMSNTKEKTDTQGSEWEIYVPSTVDNFTFRRYSITVDTFWNEWKADMGSAIVKDPDGEFTYVAVCGEKDGPSTQASGCHGYWKNEVGTFRVFFQLYHEDAKWNNTKIFAWANDGENDVDIVIDGLDMTADNGVSMNKVKDGTDQYGKYTIYYYDLQETYIIDGKKCTVNGIIFNNDNVGSIDRVKFDVDRNAVDDKTNKNCFKSLFNGLLTWYHTGSNYGTNIYIDSEYSLTHPDYKP